MGEKWRLEVSPNLTLAFVCVCTNRFQWPRCVLLLVTSQFFVLGSYLARNLTAIDSSLRKRERERARAPPSRVPCRPVSDVLSWWVQVICGTSGSCLEGTIAWARNRSRETRAADLRVQDDDDDDRVGGRVRNETFERNARNSRLGTQNRTIVGIAEEEEIVARLRLKRARETNTRHVRMKRDEEKEERRKEGERGSGIHCWNN